MFIVCSAIPNSIIIILWPLFFIGVAQNMIPLHYSFIGLTNWVKINQPSPPHNWISFLYAYKEPSKGSPSLLPGDNVMEKPLFIKLATWLKKTSLSKSRKNRTHNLVEDWENFRESYWSSAPIPLDLHHYYFQTFEIQKIESKMQEQLLSFSIACKLNKSIIWSD